MKNLGWEAFTREFKIPLTLLDLQIMRRQSKVFQAVEKIIMLGHIVGDYWTPQETEAKLQTWTEEQLDMILGKQGYDYFTKEIKLG